MKRRQLKNIALMSVIIMLLSACGFHLRGSLPLPEGIENMFVQVPQGSFQDQLVRILENAGAEIATSQAQADVVLRVLSANSNRTIGTLDERGKVNSYNILFTVDYQLDDASGNLLRESTLRESRRYDFDPELVIESESEEQDLLEDMEQDIAVRMVRQLSTVTDLN